MPTTQIPRPRRSGMLLTFLVVALGTPAASAQSFDCAKARSPLERRICADPTLGTADEALNAAWRETIRGFPLRDFLLASQRDWLAQVPWCLQGEAAACFDAFRERTQLLRHLRGARVYTNYGAQFDRWGTTLVVFQRPGSLSLWVYGAFMPAMDAATGGENHWLTDEVWTLTPLGGTRHRIEDRDEDLVLRDDRIIIPNYIMLSLRQPGLQGDYLRVR